MEEEKCLSEINDEGSTEEIRNWVVKINEKVANMESIPEKDPESIYGINEGERRRSIYRLGDTMREKFGESNFTPRIVSFGPYYYGHESCVRTQQMKENVLLHFLKKSNKTLDHYLEPLRRVVQGLKKQYSELDPKWQNDDVFLRLMILDGSFLLQIVYDDPKNPVWDIDRVRISELKEYYIHDMLLLENQIPMKVLEELRKAQTGSDYSEARVQVNHSILGLVNYPFPVATKLKYEWYSNHVLDLYRRYILFQGSMRWEKFKSIISCLPSNYFKIQLATDFRFSIPSAAELDKVGIGITTSKTTTLKDISFSGITLRLPQISVDSATKSIFLNIIAFEQLRMDHNEVTSYIYFMSRLLRSADDVRLLQLRGIIHATVSCDTIAEMFDSLTTKDIMHDPNIFLLSEYKWLGGKLRKSYNKMSNEWQRDLWQKYLKSPFGIISLIVAFIIFIAAIVQTVYTVLGYYNPKK